MKLREFCGILIGMIIFALFEGCARITPHENFISGMNGMIGRNIDNIPPQHLGDKANLISTAQISGDQFENKYIYKHPGGTCLYVFRIDSATRLISDWSIVGSDHACFINP